MFVIIIVMFTKQASVLYDVQMNTENFNMAAGVSFLLFTGLEGHKLLVRDFLSLKWYWQSGYRFEWKWRRVTVLVHGTWSKTVKKKFLRLFLGSLDISYSHPPPRTPPKNYFPRHEKTKFRTVKLSWESNARFRPRDQKKIDED